MKAGSIAHATALLIWCWGQKGGLSVVDSVTSFEQLIGDQLIHRVSPRPLRGRNGKKMLIMMKVTMKSLFEFYCEYGRQFYLNSIH